MNATEQVAQHLTFTIGEESFALEVAHVREVLESLPVTPLPRTPEHVLGVINVRGKVVPVVDLGLKLGMKRTGSSVETRIIVLDVPSADGEATVGARVDGVQEVLDFDASAIEPPPRFGTAVASHFVKGIGKREERFVLILEIESIFADEDLAGLSPDKGTEGADE